MVIPHTMTAVLLTGHGGFDQLSYRTDVAVPQPVDGEVLVRVSAAGMNNTDINTRIGWYSKAVASQTGDGATAGYDGVEDDGGWSDSPLQFPVIQGADLCGRIVGVGAGVDPARIGERIIARSMQAPLEAGGPLSCITMGSEVNGGFAQYATLRAPEAFAVTCDWTDAELASIPCAWSTAEGLLHRAQVAHDRVVITGASGGVGSAAVQLAKRRGAHVIAVCGAPKGDAVRALGADQVIDRNADLCAVLGPNSVDVFVDLVAGPGFAHVTNILQHGGRYAVAGAIAGPLVTVDVRDLYLKDLTFVGCTYQPRVVFENLVAYIEAGEIRPIVADTYPLADIVQAQQRFLEKDFVGKLVLIPPG